MATTAQLADAWNDPFLRHAMSVRAHIWCDERTQLPYVDVGHCAFCVNAMRTYQGASTSSRPVYGFGRHDAEQAGRTQMVSGAVLLVFAFLLALLQIGATT